MESLILKIKNTIMKVVNLFAKIVPIKKGKNILIIKIDKIGDFILFSPSVPYYKERFGDKLFLCVSESVKDLVENIFNSKKIIYFNRKKFENNVFYRFGFIFKLRRFGFKKIIYPNYTKEKITNLLIKLSGIKESISWPKQEKRTTHEIERNKEFLQKLGIRVLDYKTNFNLSNIKIEKMNDKYVTFGIGAGDIKRRWNIENFTELGKKIIEKDGIKILLIGGVEDKKNAEKIKKALIGNIVDITGLGLLETLKYISKSETFIGNDSGAMHMASSMNIPVIEISCHPKRGAVDHPNSPLRFGPYGVKSIILQPEPDEFCKESCDETNNRFINKIKVNEIFNSYTRI